MKNLKRKLSLALVLVMLLTAAVPMEASAAVKVSKVTMNLTAVTLTKGKTFTLKAYVSPSKASKKAVKWVSSNKKTATVTSKGLVKGIKAGTAIITAKAVDGSGKKATCKVTVKAASTIPNVTDKVLNMKAGAAAKKLGLTKLYNDPEYDYTWYYKRKGKKLWDTSSDLQYFTGWEKQGGMWNLSITDKTIAFYGVRVGMKGAQAKKMLKKNGWVYKKREESIFFDGATELYFDKAKFKKRYMYFYIVMEKGAVVSINYIVDLD